MKNVLLQLLVFIHCLVIAGNYPGKRAVIKCVKGRKICDGDLKEHCWDRDYKHAVEECAKPIVCKEGKLRFLIG